MTAQLLKGAWEAILRHLDELTGRQVRLTVLPQETPIMPNENALAALREIAERESGGGLVIGANVTISSCSGIMWA